MTFKDDLTAQVRGFARDHWGDIPVARVPPTPEDLTFGNSGKRITACVLYADLHQSTSMVDALSDTGAAEYYKAFLHCAAKIIKRNDGNIQAYDGDRVMGIYSGINMADRAVITALELNWAVRNIVNPQFLEMYGAANHRVLQHTVGIDCGQMLVAKTGVRDDRDLVWVGSAANYAAKLNSFPTLQIEYSTRITPDVKDQLSQALVRVVSGDIWMGPYASNVIPKSHYRTNFWKGLP